MMALLGSFSAGAANPPGDSSGRDPKQDRSTAASPAAPPDRAHAPRGVAVGGVTLASTLGGIAGAALVIVTSGATLVAISTFAPESRGLAALAMLSALVGAPALIGVTAATSGLVLIGPREAPAIGTAAAGAAIFGGMLGAGFGLVVGSTFLPRGSRNRLTTAAAAVGGLSVLGVLGASAGGGMSALFLSAFPPEPEVE